MLETKVLKMYFDTRDGVRIISVPNPKEDLDSDTVEAVMQYLVDNEIFADIISAIKAVIVITSKEEIYAA